MSLDEKNLYPCLTEQVIKCALLSLYLINNSADLGVEC